MANVTVKLTIGNFSVEVTGEQDYVDKKVEDFVSRFVSRRISTAEPTAAPSAAPEAGGKPMSPAEFVKQSKAKTQTDRALVLGYYLEKVASNPSFTSSELADAGIKIKQPFANASDAVAKLTGRGLMMSAGDKEGQRAYSLTASGDTYVESLLEAEPKKQ